MADPILLTQPVSHPTAVALGLFDGVHLGHQAVLRAAAACRQDGLLPCAFTFRSSSMPQKQGRTLEYLYTEPQKLRRLGRFGIAGVCQMEFSQLKGQSGEAFCRDILQGQLHARRVFCGRDFRFGNGARWGFSDLEAFGREMGFSVSEILPVRLGGAVVSSSAIRQALRDGRPEQASAMLGAPYEIEGTVQHGKQLGRTLSFPTLNLPFSPGQLVPKYGVYAASVWLPDGKRYDGVTDIGVKPTVSAERIPQAETHLFHYSGNLYGKSCRVQLFRFLRAEQRFETLSELQAAIERDCAHAQTWLHSNIKE